MGISSTQDFIPWKV